MFVLMHLLIATQVYPLAKRLVLGDGTDARLAVPLRYAPMPVPATRLTTFFRADGRLGADFAQVYFPSQDRSSLANAYESETTLDPWRRPSRYAPLVHLACSLSLCGLPYGPAGLLHLVIQTVLFLASLAYALHRLGLRRHVLPVLLFVNTTLFLTPVGLSWFERGQFTLYVASCYSWLTLAVITGRRRYAVLATVFGYVKWTTFPFIGVVLTVHLLDGRSWREIRERLALPFACGSTLLLLIVALPTDTIAFVRGLSGQALGAAALGLSLVKILPRFAVKALPFALAITGVACGRWSARRAPAYVLPLLAGSAVLLATYPTYAHDYTVPCLTAFIPPLLHWARSPGVGPALSRTVLTLFLLFVLLASFAITVLGLTEPVVIASYVVVGLVMIGAPFLVPRGPPGARQPVLG